MAPLLPRMHLFEIDDQPWFPSFLRAHVQKGLTHAWTIQVPLLQSSSAAAVEAAVLRRVLDRSVSEHTYIDFCAGAGGPTPYVEQALNRELRLFPQGGRHNKNDNKNNKKNRRRERAKAKAKAAHNKQPSYVVIASEDPTPHEPPKETSARKPSRSSGSGQPSYAAVTAEDPTHDGPANAKTSRGSSGGSKPSYATVSSKDASRHAPANGSTGSGSGKKPSYATVASEDASHRAPANGSGNANSKVKVATVESEEEGSSPPRYVPPPANGTSGGGGPSYVAVVSEDSMSSDDDEDYGDDDDDNGEGAVEFILTDLHPHLTSWEEASKKSDNVSYIGVPVDAANAPRDLLSRSSGDDGGKGKKKKGVFRLFNLAFHHFDDELAKAILRNTVETSEGFGIFELQSRTPSGFLSVILFGLLILLIAPLLYWWSPLRLFFVYWVPVIPFVLVFDGLVSCLRTRTPPEVERLLRTCGADRDELQDWDVLSGTQMFLWPVGKLHWVIGRKRSAAGGGEVADGGAAR
ncbi:hypothetical protein F4778DRAFT_752785 [Xylariomycetidae sp. FL2044]|nr:hypothetical protein F4778DRAFT_752785 [Xylariomycetidae sp. FL2044]